MFGEPDIQDGDRLVKHCSKCGERFERIEGESENISRCTDCYDRYEVLRDEYKLAAGKWTCRNEDFRRAVQDLAEEEFDMHTYVEGNSVYFFE